MATVNREMLIPQIELYKRQLDQDNGEKSSRTLFNKNEDYKRNITNRAHDILKAENWSESEIGSGTIAHRAEQAVKKHVNLISRFQINAFLTRIKESSAEAERIFYDLYHEHKEMECFEQLCGFFGRRYDLIAYLFFIIDPGRYLPIKPSFFDNAFRSLNIDFHVSGQCCLENYQEFIQTVSAIRDVMKDYLKCEDIDLLDAHSFLWSLSRNDGGAKAEDIEDMSEKELTSEECARVVHREYGKGTILEMNEEDIYVDFGGRKRIFPSDAFEREYLKLIDYIDMHDKHVRRPE